MIDTRGKHLLLEYGGCSADALNDRAKIESLMKEAARAAGATIVTSTFHEFAPQGVSGVVVVEESHLSIHTWPEKGYAAVDFYTCGECEPAEAHRTLYEGLGASLYELLTVERGVGAVGHSMRIGEHSTNLTAPQVVARRRAI